MFEDIGVVPVVGTGGIGARDSQQVAQFGEESW